MFWGADSFNQIVGGWDVSSMIDMSWMFYSTDSFNQPLDTWDVSSVTDMGGMFRGATSFDQNLGGWYVTINSTSIDRADVPGVVGTISAQNSYLDKQNPTYAIEPGGDSDRFTIIDGNQLIMVLAAADQTTYTVTIAATRGAVFEDGNNRRTVEVSLVGDSRDSTLVAEAGLSGLIVPVDHITDDLVLAGASGIATYQTADRTYAAVASGIGVQLLDITDPDNIVPADSVTHGGGLAFNDVNTITVYESGGRTYAAVASYFDDSIQLLDITDPDNTLSADHITDDDDLALSGTFDIASYQAADRTYAAVASGIGVQLLDITDPDNIVPADSVTHGGGLAFLGANAITVYKSGDHTYAAVASFLYDGVQLLDITDPDNIVPADSVTHGGGRTFDGPFDIATYQAGDRTYAAVASGIGVQLLDITDPDNIVPADSVTHGGGLAFLGTNAITVYESGDRTYAAVASGIGIQLLDITNPDNIVPADDITDDDNFALGGAHDIDIYESGNRTYIAVTAYDDGGIQLLDITDPDNIVPADNITDDDNLALDHIRDISTYESGNRTYAAVTSGVIGSVQLLDLTDPTNIVPADHITDDDDLALDNTRDISIYKSGDRTYTAVTSRYGVQLLDITEPANIVPADHPTNIVPADHITDDDDLALGGAFGIAVYQIGDRTYTVVTSFFDDGIQLLDITDPTNIVPADHITDDDDLALGGAFGIAVYQIGDRTYTVVTSFFDDGIQLLDITDPANIVPVNLITYDDGDLALRGVYTIAVYESNDQTYAAVASSGDDGVLLLNITDPYGIVQVDSITDDHGLVLNGAEDIAIFKAGDHTYAAVASSSDNGVQILQLAENPGGANNTLSADHPPDS
jgi:surface protein